jgi:hypothetical protein
VDDTLNIHSLIIIINQKLDFMGDSHSPNSITLDKDEEINKGQFVCNGH